MAVNYTANGDSFIADKPRAWSERRLLNNGGFDFAPDGKRIAVIVQASEQEAQQPQNHVIFLENFFDELRRRVKP